MRGTRADLVRGHMMKHAARKGVDGTLSLEIGGAASIRLSLGPLSERRKRLSRQQALRGFELDPRARD